MEYYKQILGIVSETETLLVIRPTSIESRIFWNMYIKNGLYEYLEDTITLKDYPVLLISKTKLNYILLKYRNRDITSITMNGNKEISLDSVATLLKNNDEIYINLIGGNYIH